jgi:hypothetical protein
MWEPGVLGALEQLAEYMPAAARDALGAMERAEPVPGAVTEPEAPSFRVKPLPGYAEAHVAGCQDTGMRVVIGCGRCAGSAP